MNRIGFHYFSDTEHYRQQDLKTWLPRLQSLGAHWLVLKTHLARAIPENFIRELLAAKIEPIVQFGLSPTQLPPISDVELLLNAYAKWGLNDVVLFDKPNLRSNWQPAAWSQVHLVERFLDVYLPMAERCLQAGLNPIFPPLEPGGDYWDTAFLRGALQGIQRRGHKTLIQKLVVGAYAQLDKQPLTWGMGGPECWPGSRPYSKSTDTQDHRGFRIFDWYDAVIQSVFVKPKPIFLFGLGTPLKDETPLEDHTAKNLTIARLLAGEAIQEIKPIPPNVIGGAFLDLCDSPNHQSWHTPSGDHLPVVGAIQNWVGTKTGPGNHAKTASHAIQHYLLLPSYDGGVTDFHLDVIRPFVKKFQPTVGFSTQEAIHAKRVTVVGGQDVFPEAEINTLRNAGCIVDRIEDGMDIASRLPRS